MTWLTVASAVAVEISSPQRLAGRSATRASGGWRMPGYKSAWRGRALLTSGRFYPSSKKCSGCGAVKAKLPLAERTYACERCGLVEDRDVNAARNLLSLAAGGAAAA